MAAYRFPDITADYRYTGLEKRVQDLARRGIATIGYPPKLEASFSRRPGGCWGCVGDQRLMSFGKPVAVKEEVRQRIETMADGDGFIAAPAYATHSDVPWENIAAFSEAVDRYG